MTHILELLQQIIAPDGVMMAITPLIGAGVGLASSIGNAIFGGLSANKQKREQLRAIRKQQQENRNWYNRRYNEDATQRADVQRMLSRTNEAIKARNRAAAGKQKVVGGTDASLASTQQANAAAVGDALSEVAAKAEARKDNIEAQYRERKADLDAQENAVKANAASAARTATAQAATGAVNAGIGMMMEQTSGQGDKQTSGQGTSGQGDKQTSGRVNKQTSKQVDEGRVNEQASGQGDEQTSGRVNKQTSKQVDEGRVNEQASGQGDELTSIVMRPWNSIFESPDLKRTAY